MTKLTLDEILNIPQLAFYLEPQEFGNFILNKKDFESLANLYNADKIDPFTQLLENEGLDESMSKNTDSLVTRNFGNVMKRDLLTNEKLVNKSIYLLFLSGLASKYLKESFSKDSNSVLEIVYTNGDIINIKNGQAMKKGIEDYSMIPTDIAKIRESLAEGILIASKELQDSLKKRQKINISGIYMGRGLNPRREKFKFSLSELDDMRKSKIVFESLSIDKIKELIDKNVITRPEILKVASQNFSKEKVLILLKEGILKKEDVLKKVFKEASFESVIRNKKTSDGIRFLLYAIDEISINDLEKSLQNSEQEISKDVFEKSSKYFDKRKIGELLTHNILGYIESKNFLNILEKNNIINNEENTYFQKIMEDFKCDELLNKVETEELEKKDSKSYKFFHDPRLTIDPELRTQYLKSIGSIKRVKINGEIGIAEDEKSRVKTNSLDGYELFIIPDKKIAILEKRYLVTRDKFGHMIYKINKKGERIPAVDNATYILPIGLAKDLVESKNKKELIASPYVYRTFHTMNWISATESKMKLINPEINFEKENSEKWKEKIAKDYKKRKEEREK